MPCIKPEDVMTRDDVHGAACRVHAGQGHDEKRKKSP